MDKKIGDLGTTTEKVMWWCHEKMAKLKGDDLQAKLRGTAILVVVLGFATYIYVEDKFNDAVNGIKTKFGKRG